VVYNVYLQSSLFVRELYEKYPAERIRELLDTKATELLQLHMEVVLQEVEDAKREEKLRKEAEYDALTPAVSDIHKLYLDVDNWVSSLNGTTYRKLRHTILPHPLPFRIRNAPTHYVVPAAMGIAAAAALEIRAAAVAAAAAAAAAGNAAAPAVEPDQAAGMVVEEEKKADEVVAVVPHALFGPGNEDDDDDDDDDDDNDHDEDMYEADHFDGPGHEDEEEEEEEEVLAGYRNPWFITVNSLEESARNFLDAAMLRFLQEMRRTQELACTGDTTVDKYIFKPASDCFSQLRRRGQNIDNKHKQRIAFDYQDYQVGGTCAARACKLAGPFPPSTPQVMLIGCSSSPET
jgi:hypothetical protein